MVLDKKREVEIGQMQKDWEKKDIQHEATILSLKKKPYDPIEEMLEQVDQFIKLRVRVEKDNATIKHGRS